MGDKQMTTKRKKDVVLITMDGWEATYVSGVLVEQGPPIRKDRRIAYFLGLADKHKFDIRDLREVQATKEDAAMVDEQYVFPDKLSKLFGDYSA